MTAPSHEPLQNSRGPRAFLAPLVPWLTLGLMLLIAAIDLPFTQPANRLAGDFGRIALLALAAAALLVAVRRARGRTRNADAFYPLVLLNPLLYSHPAGTSAALDQTLLAAGLLGLMTAAIVAMRRDNLLRYLAVAALAFALIALSKSFLMLLPALLLWFLYIGYLLARSTIPKERTRGFIIMALGEISLILFGLACILEQPAPTPTAGKLFDTIITFADFPLIVLAIMMLALGWRKGPHPHASAPPHFAGMLALLVGLLTMLLNNFQSGILPPPGADQTTILLVLVYTVSALQGPRRLQWLIPPALLLAAALATAFR